MLFECKMPCSIIQLQCRPTILLPVQSVLTMLSAHRVCVLWLFKLWLLKLTVAQKTWECNSLWGVNNGSCLTLRLVMNIVKWTRCIMDANKAEANLASPPGPSPGPGKVCAHFVLGRKYSYYTESDILTNSNIQVDVTHSYIELKNTDSCHQCQRVTLN